jgi:hypothetical protein
MWSLKDEIKDLSIGPKVSVASDLFGYVRGHVPRMPDGTGAKESLLAWAKLGRGNSFNVNTIFVGPESFTSTMFDEVDTAIHRMRQIYAPIGVGVKWVWRWHIDAADADGLDVLTDEGEVDDLLSGWAVDNGSIGLFFPAGWNVPDGDGGFLLGKSVVDGPCPDEQSGTKGAKGSCAGLTGPLTSSRTTSHEIGHYLGLTHKQDHPENLMCQTGKANKPTWKAVAFGVVDGDDQPNIVKVHCMVSKWWVP